MRRRGIRLHIFFAYKTHRCETHTIRILFLRSSRKAQTDIGRNGIRRSMYSVHFIVAHRKQMFPQPATDALPLKGRLNKKATDMSASFLHGKHPDKRFVFKGAKQLQGLAQASGLQ